jgi:hypothetical protein
MTAIRVACAGPLVLAVALASGCKSEKKAQAEEIIRQGIKEKTGKTVDSVDIRPEGNGNYAGTAQVEGEPWDVKVIKETDGLRWEAVERMTRSKVEKITKKLIVEKLGSAAEDFKIIEQEPGKFAGTFTVNIQVEDLKMEDALGRKKHEKVFRVQSYKYTSTVVGVNVQSFFEPIN